MNRVVNLAHVLVVPVLVAVAAAAVAGPVLAGQAEAPDKVEALRSAGVPAELHVFAEGDHGFGLRNSQDKPIAIWPHLVAAWINDQCSPPEPM